MIRVYVAGDYSADNVIDVLKNIGIGTMMCSELFNDGMYPYCPWADRDFIFHSPFNDFKVKQFLNASMAWLEVSDAIFVISGIGNGGGVDSEIKRAKALDIPVFTQYDKLLKFAKENSSCNSVQGER